MELSQRALERRLKRHLLKAPQDFLAVCTPGFEPVLQGEIATLPEVEVMAHIHGGVLFSGPLDTVYHANLQLRTANRVLLRLGDFLAQSYPMLFDHARKIPWELQLGFEDKVNIRVSARKSRLRHQDNIAETVHGAILRRLEPLGLRADLSEEAPIQIFVRVFQDRCTLSLNTSGEHLHRRGYRQSVTDAPIRETLAAGILLSVGWQDYDLIIDPMCGSGTFLTEAAQLAKHMAPGKDRSFAFEHLPYFQPSKWARFKRAAEAGKTACGLKLAGADLDPGAVRASRDNAERAGVLDCLDVEQGDARALSYGELARGANRSLLLSNLPYSRRLGGTQEVRGLYRDLYRHLSTTCRGWDYAFVSSHPEWLEEAGFQATNELAFLNGGLRVSLVQGVIG